MTPKAVSAAITWAWTKRGRSRGHRMRDNHVVMRDNHVVTLDWSRVERSRAPLPLSPTSGGGMRESFTAGRDAFAACCGTCEQLAAAPFTSERAVC